MACIISLINPSKEKVIKTTTLDRNYVNSEEEVERLNEELNKKPNKKDLFWKVTTIGI